MAESNSTAWTPCFGPHSPRLIDDSDVSCAAGTRACRCLSVSSPLAPPLCPTCARRRERWGSGPQDPLSVPHCCGQVSQGAAHALRELAPSRSKPGSGRGTKGSRGQVGLKGEVLCRENVHGPEMPDAHFRKPGILGRAYKDPSPLCRIAAVSDTLFRRPPCTLSLGTTKVLFRKPGNLGCSLETPTHQLHEIKRPCTSLPETTDVLLRKAGA